MKKEPIDVKGRVVLIRSREAIDEDSMSQIGRTMRKAGAIDVVFAIEEYYDIAIEAYSDDDLEAIGLGRIEKLAWAKPPKKSTRQTTH